MRSAGDSKMGMLRRRVPSHYIPIHPDNVAKKDWIILLEAGTIVGPSTEKLRVAKATMERKIVTKYNLFLRKQHFLVLEEYDPRIHALYFCPQLYRSDSNGQLVPLEGEEIGRLLAQAMQYGVVENEPWYQPSKQLPAEPVITATMETDFDTVIVDRPSEEARETSLPETKHDGGQRNDQNCNCARKGSDGGRAPPPQTIAVALGPCSRQGCRYGWPPLDRHRKNLLAGARRGAPMHRSIAPETRGGVCESLDVESYCCKLTQC